MGAASFSLTCGDGHKMPMYYWACDEPVKAVILIAHGMAEYAQRYDRIANTFNKAGYAVYAFDHRAHGNAVRSIEEQGISPLNWFNQQIADIQLAVDELRGRHSANKIFLLGHSMGSFIGQRYFQIHGSKIDGLILSATNGKQDPLLPAGIALAWLQTKLYGSGFKSHLIDKLSFGKFNAAFKPNRTTNDWLSRDEGEVDKYVADPKCGFVCTAAFYYDFFVGIREAFKSANWSQVPKDVPVYALAGEKDPVGLNGKGFLRLVHNWKEAGVKDISYHLYPDGRHEMMNEINRGEVLGNIINWLNRHI